MKRFGFLDRRLEAYLKEAGMEVELFESVSNRILLLKQL